MKISIFFLSILQVVFGRYIQEKCSTPELVNPFDITKYLGLWYELARDPEFYWELGGICGSAHYTLWEDNRYVGVYNS